MLSFTHLVWNLFFTNFPYFKIKFRLEWFKKESVYWLQLVPLNHKHIFLRCTITFTQSIWLCYQLHSIYYIIKSLELHAITIAKTAFSFISFLKPVISFFASVTFKKHYVDVVVCGSEYTLLLVRIPNHFFRIHIDIPDNSRRIYIS